MNSEKISIIVPVYNVEDYIENCLQSLLNQTYLNIEIILVDDESPDRCPEICNCYANQDKRVRVIHQQNKGLPGARNSGLKIATGEWVLFVDSDDWLVEDALEKLIAVSHQNIDLIMFRKKKCSIYQSGKAVGTGKTYDFSSEELIQLLDDTMDPMYKTFKKYDLDVVSAWSKMYRKSFLQKSDLSFFEEVKVHEDIPYAVAVYSAKPRILYLDYYIYMYRYNSASITNSFRKNYDIENTWLIERLKVLKPAMINSEEWKRMFYDRLMVCTVNVVLKCFCHPSNKKSYFERKEDFLNWTNRNDICDMIFHVKVDRFERKKKYISWLIIKKKFFWINLFSKMVYYFNVLVRKFTSNNYI